MGTICTKILGICISVIWSSQNWMPLPFICISVSCSSPDWRIPRYHIHTAQRSFVSVFLLFCQNQARGPLYTTCRENQRHITKPLIQILKLKFLVPFSLFSALCIHFLCIAMSVCLLKNKRDLQFMIVLSFKNVSPPMFICFSKALLKYC